MLGLRTDKYSYMRYHGIWDCNELYDMDNDPDQMNNLLGDVRIIAMAAAIRQFPEREYLQQPDRGPGSQG